MLALSLLKIFKDGPTCLEAFRRLHVPEFIFWKNDSYPNARTTIEKSDATYYGSEHEAPE
ncbi:MAG: hypothetical protein CM15mP49_20670 [Actinomycetota bacterium]|nr:MAG: hypothetical protein CM15mP49_20670 [Actinomycetota bacterium]